MLFSYVGHSQLIKGRQDLGLARSDTSTDRLPRRSTSLLLSSVQRELEDCESSIKLVMLDYCYSGLAVGDDAQGAPEVADEIHRLSRLARRSRPESPTSPPPGSTSTNRPVSIRPAHGARRAAITTSAWTYRGNPLAGAGASRACAWSSAAATTRCHWARPTSSRPGSTSRRRGRDNDSGAPALRMLGNRTLETGAPPRCYGATSSQ